jgi:hypothetical protein
MIAAACPARTAGLVQDLRRRCHCTSSCLAFVEVTERTRGHAPRRRRRVQRGGKIQSRPAAQQRFYACIESHCCRHMLQRRQKLSVRGHTLLTLGNLDWMKSTSPLNNRPGKTQAAIHSKASTILRVSSPSRVLVLLVGARSYSVADCEQSTHAIPATAGGARSWHGCQQTELQALEVLCCPDGRLTCLVYCPSRSVRLVRKSARRVGECPQGVPARINNAERQSTGQRMPGRVLDRRSNNCGELCVEEHV